MKKYSIAAAILFLLLSCSEYFAQTAVPVASIKLNNASGIPVNLNKVYTVKGVVIAANQFGSAGPGAVQDSSGAISVYGSSFTSKVKIGDSVLITSTLTHYNGLTQLDFSKAGSIVTVISSDNIIQPDTVTIAQINAQRWDSLEVYESKLVRINGVTISGTGNFSGGTSGKNYTINDATGSTAMRIDESVNISGTPIPSRKVDIIGILSQYVTTSPYKLGYQIIPRFINDIIDGELPVILNPIVASNIDTASFTVYFNTLRKGDSQIKYGLTQSLELDSVIVDSLSTSHAVKITGLKPNTKYYYQAVSTNPAGRSMSSINSAVTASQDLQAGKINVYFNFAVDTSVSIPGNAAKGNVNFAQKLIERINAATYSIDMAVYSFFGMSDVANAIIAAKNRGVKIRVVYHYRNPLQNSMQLLADAGIKISMRPDDGGLMHNKFFVFDGRDNNSGNDWVWTGSWNVTSTEIGWKNNVIEINDLALANAYTAEFEEMWGSQDDTPNSANAKFGPAKTNNTVHSFTIDGKAVQQYFSPTDQTDTRIAAAMRSADSSLYFSQFTFTSDNIASNIRSANTAGAMDIRGIIDNINDSGSEYQVIKAFGEVFDYNLTPSFHHKYGIVDASYPGRDPLVVSGSHNWSRSANESNDENTLVIHDLKIANQFMQEFKKRYNELGGTVSFVVPFVTSVKEKDKTSYPEDIVLYQNYPNPFNPVTSISFFIPEETQAALTVYNSLGQKVMDLFSGKASAGKHIIDFSAEHLTSGVYYYRLLAGNLVFTKKMLILK